MENKKGGLCAREPNEKKRTDQPENYVPAYPS